VTRRPGIVPASLLTTGAVVLVAALAMGRGLDPAPSAAPTSRPAEPSSAPSPAAAPSATTSVVAGRAADYLLVLDFLPGIAEEVEVDPIAGNPDSDSLSPILGEPSEFGAEAASGQADGGLTRCGIVDRPTVEALARALNGRVAADQRIDPAATETRTLLHWSAAEGFASIRIFARGAASSPSCDGVAELD
jgi:hypothetical protein